MGLVQASAELVSGSLAAIRGFGSQLFLLLQSVFLGGKTSASMAEWHLVAKEACLGDWGRFLWIQASAGGDRSWPAVVKAHWDLCLVAQLVPGPDWGMLLV